jgi:subtilisin family serine protease
MGIKIENISKWFNAVTAYLDDQSLEEVKKLSFVLKIKPVVIYKGKNDDNLKEETTNNSLINKVTSNLDYGNSLTQNQLSNIPKVHDLEINGSDVLVGVLDTGFDWKRHNSLKELKVLKEYDFVFHDENTANENDDRYDQHGHGTLCFSILAGYAPGFLIGPAYNSEFLLAKTENMWSETKAEEDNWVAAIEWMEALGVDVTSTSLGYNEFDNNISNYTYKDMDGQTAIITIAANIASAKGVTVVVAAGNEGNTNWRYITAPADGLDVITIGAVSSGRTRAAFSSIGPSYDGRIKPDVVTMGVSVYHANSGTENFYSYSNGTSVACPIAAGIATLIKSARPELTPFQIREALRSSGSQALLPNNELGWGVVDAYKAITYYGIVYSNTPIITTSSSEIKISTYIASRYTIDKNSVKLFYSSDNKNYFSVSMEQDEIWDETNTGRYSAIVTNVTQDSPIYYYFTATDEQGERRHPFNAPENINVFGVETIQEMPNDYFLYQNYPNPFNPSTEIKFDVKLKGHVKLYIYNSLGQIVNSLVERDMDAGTYRVKWDGLDQHGKKGSSGAYYYSIQVNSHTQTKKMLLLK